MRLIGCQLSQAAKVEQALLHFLSFEKPSSDYSCRLEKVWAKFSKTEEACGKFLRFNFGRRATLGRLHKILPIGGEILMSGKERKPRKLSPEEIQRIRDSAREGIQLLGSFLERVDSRRGLPEGLENVVVGGPNCGEAHARFWNSLIEAGKARVMSLEDLQRAHLIPGVELLPPQIPSEEK